MSYPQTRHTGYAEAISFLYNSNIFTMGYPLVLLYLKDYLLLPQRFAETRHLQLVPWIRFSDPKYITGCLQ